MKFLTWSSQKDAKDSLKAVNAMYGCPYVAKNGYRMDRWDTLRPSRDGKQWGFFNPKAQLGKGRDELRAVLAPGFIEQQKKLVEFYPEEEVV